MNDKKTQIPNLVVYVAIYGILFGISIWLLITDKDSPTNWLLYLGMIGSILAGLVKFILHSRKQHPHLGLEPMFRRHLRQRD